MAPWTPTTPTSPSNRGDDGNVSGQPPKTGDTADLALWMALAFSSLGGMLLLLGKAHRKRS